MKDKRTYTNAKEHGEDMSYENDANLTSEAKEDRGSGDLTYLIEMHQKEIWDWKQKESEWIKTENALSGTKKIVEQLSGKLIEQVRIIEQLEQEIERLVAENKK